MVSEEKNLPEEKNISAWDYDYDDEYAFGEEVVYNIPTIEHNIRPKINQGMNTKSQSACTIFGAWSQLIRLFGLDLTREQANKTGLEVIDYCIKNGGYKVGEGWGTPTAVNYVCKWWNEIGYKTFKKEKVFYLRLLWNNDLVREALSKGHMVGYTKTIQWAGDQIYGYVNKKAEEYKETLGHRLNLKGPTYITVATGGATQGNAQWGSQDNYFEQIGTNFFIEDLGEYINKGVYAYVYLILPENCLEMDTEKQKKKIEEERAVNALIGSLTTVRGSMPEKYQNKLSELAKELRKDYPNARALIEDEKLKHYQSVVDQLSFNWKRADSEYQEGYAELAKVLRETFGLK